MGSFEMELVRDGAIVKTVRGQAMASEVPDARGKTGFLVRLMALRGSERQSLTFMLSGVPAPSTQSSTFGVEAIREAKALHSEEADSSAFPGVLDLLPQGRHFVMMKQMQRTSEERTLTNYVGHVGTLDIISMDSFLAASGQATGEFDVEMREVDVSSDAPSSPTGETLRLRGWFDAAFLDR